MRKSNAAIKRCKTMSTLQKILGGKWKLENGLSIYILM